MPRAGGTPEPPGLDLSPRTEVVSRCSHRSESRGSYRSETPVSHRAQTPSRQDDSCRARHADGGTLILCVDSGPALLVEMLIDVPRDTREAGRSTKLFRKMLRVVAGLQTPQTSRYDQRKWIIHGDRAAEATLRRFDRLGFVGNFDSHVEGRFEDTGCRSSLASWYLIVIDGMAIPEDRESLEYSVVEPLQPAAVRHVWPGRKACLKYTLPSGLGGTCDIDEDDFLLGRQVSMSPRQSPTLEHPQHRQHRDAYLRLGLPGPMVQDVISAVKVLNLQSGQSIFQFDCGEGDLLRKICFEVGCSGIGVDRHSSAIRQAQQRVEAANIANVEFHVVSAWQKHNLSSCGAVLAFLPREALWSLAEYTLPKCKLKKDTPVFVCTWACGDLLGLSPSYKTNSGLTCLLYAGGRPMRSPPPAPKVFKPLMEQAAPAGRTQKTKPRVNIREVIQAGHSKHKKSKDSASPKSRNQSKEASQEENPE